MSLYPINPAIQFRKSPSPNLPPYQEFGLNGFLCEQYRKETGQGEWKMWGFVNGSPKMATRKRGLTKDDLKENVEENSRAKYYEETGSWIFILNNKISFGLPQPEVLQHFNLTVETLSIINESLSTR